MRFFLPIIAVSCLFHFNSVHSFSSVTQFTSRQPKKVAIPLGSSIGAVDVLPTKQSLPPVLSKVIQQLPFPFSGIHEAGIIAKVRERSSAVANFLQKTKILQLIYHVFAFRLMIVMSARYIWPIHLQLMAKYGAIKSLFLTANMIYLGTIIPLLTFLTAPAFIPTSHESKPIAKKNFQTAMSFLSSKQTMQVLLVALILPVVLLWATSPASLLQSTSLPSLKLLNIVKHWFLFSHLTDPAYYWLHRTQHDGSSKNPVVKWLNKIHRVHHSNDHNNLLPYDTLRIHPADFAISSVCVFLGPMILKTHPLMSLGFYGYSAILAMFDHCDYVDMVGSKHHVTHHQKTNCNYAKLLDYGMKTTRSESIDLLFRSAALKQNMRRKLSTKEMDDLKNTASSGVKTKVLKSDEIVVQYGDSGESFFVLLDGTCTASLPNIEDGTNTIVSVYKEPGSFFGELALVRGQSRAATVKAGKSGATVAEIPKSSFSLISSLTSTFEQNAERYKKVQR